MLEYVIWQENFFPSFLANMFGTGVPQEEQSPPPPLYKMWFRGTVAHPFAVSQEEWPSGEASFSLTFATVMAPELEDIVGQLYCLPILILFRVERP